MTFICIPRQWPKNLLPRSTKETMRYDGGRAGYQYNIYIRTYGSIFWKRMLGRENLYIG